MILPAIRNMGRIICCSVVFALCVKTTLQQVFSFFFKRLFKFRNVVVFRFIQNAPFLLIIRVFNANAAKKRFAAICTIDLPFELFLSIQSSDWSNSDSKYGENYLMLCCFCAKRKNNTTSNFLFSLKRLLQISNHCWSIGLTQYCIIKLIDEKYA